MHRETATETRDMPHEYRADVGDPSCTTCAGDKGDARHRVWSELNTASRQTAAVHEDRPSLRRTLGS